MLAKSETQPQSRGIVLVLVLAMLGLLALVGVTFATFAGQARVNNRNYQQSLLQPQADELFDFAMAQLISDTADIRSAIRGHSLARDMYGQGTTSNGYLPQDPTTGQPFLITAVAPSTTLTNGYSITTNIAADDPNFYGYDFTRWIMRVGGSTLNNTAGTVSQTFEIIIDSQFNANSSSARTFQVYIGPTDGEPIYTQATPTGYFTPVTTGGTLGTTLYNPTSGAQTILPGYALYQDATAGPTGTSGLSVQFQLDGRWLHAFNGPGMGANAALGNFRYNSLDPNKIGMDEDYDACDLENWFLAIQSADGNVIIPSFHRPANIRYDPTNATTPVSDWARVNVDGSGGSSAWASSASRILRPVAADGNDPTAFRDLVPDMTTGQITYDVDNDGDGVPDSVWLDLGYPARADASGRLYKPLFAFMVIGLNGRIPLNTAGNLAGPGQTSAEHLGNSVSEIDPTYALQNAYSGSSSTDYDPFNQLGNASPPDTYPSGTGTNSYWGPSNGTNDGQVDNTLVVASSGTYSGSQVSQGIDVRLSQLRNLLAGTRPQTSPLANPQLTDPAGGVNGDDNLVWGNWTGSPGQAYYLPNSIADYSDAINTTDANGNIYVQRTASPVPGRWGEAQSIPGNPIPNPNGALGSPPLNMVQSSYTNPVRAGYSFDINDLVTSAATYGTTTFPRDAADDNFNAFDPYPTRAGTTDPTTGAVISPPESGDLPLGEVGDADFFDAAGANLLPVERMRRWVTPADINGTGRVVQWTVPGASGSPRGAYRGADNFGRVQFYSYFRPGGNPGVINTQYSYADGIQTPVVAAPLLGGILYPPVPADATATDTQSFYAAGPNPINPTGATGDLSPAATAYPNYMPDVTNNPLHGFEAYKIPNLFQNPGGTLGTIGYNPQSYGGMPIDQGVLYTATTAPTTNEPGGGPGLAGSVPSTYVQPTPGSSPAGPIVPALYATYDSKVNQTDRSDGLNEADEMNLYALNPLLDSPFGAGDLEWLYRQQDVDGSTLSSRLSQLAPISFANTIDGIRRRRLFSLDTLETNNFVWTNDNPGNTFANNSRFTVTATTAQSASFQQLSANTGGAIGTPTLAHRDKKINLNYPLPVSNDPNEPIRQKWINDTYQTLKWILPPDSVDTAEELAQLSQYVINIIDFRDPDATMTHWVNPDVVLTPGTPPVSGVTPVQPMPPALAINYGSGTLDQYGMEYNPVALNEALAYSFTSATVAGASPTFSQTNRFFVELVNTLPAAYNPGYDYSGASATNNYYGNASAVTLGGFNYTLDDPYSGGCWDLVFTFDEPMSRPDPYRGELPPANPTYSIAGSATANKVNYFGLIPLNRDTFYSPPSTTAVNGGDVTLLAVNPAAISPNFPLGGTMTPTGSTYFYVVGNPPNTTSLTGGAAGAAGTPSTTESTSAPTNGITVTTAAGIVGGPEVAQSMLAAYDPFNISAATPSFAWHPGILPGSTAAGAPPNYSADLPAYNPTPPTGQLTPNIMNFPPSSASVTTGGTRPAMNLWVCLRRPANPFAPVSASNPMCVVDSMRFPYIEGTGSGVNANATVTPPGGGTATVAYTYGTYNTIYSAQRLQPFRGGHAVAAPNAVPVTGNITFTGPDTGTPSTPTTTVFATGPTTTSGATLTMQPPDPRYGYTEQLAVPAPSTSTQNYGYYSNGSAGTYPATELMYHTLGAPNDSAENWDYLVFNDRDFTSVAELTLVPGCPPGLFTKQFVEFAPSQISAANIFATVAPVITPTFQSAVTSGTATAPPTASMPPPIVPAVTCSTVGSATTITSAWPFVFTTATAPFLTISQATSAPAAPLPSSSATPPTTTIPPFPAFSIATLVQPTMAINGTVSISVGSDALTTSVSAPGLYVGAHIMIVSDASNTVYTVVSGSGTLWTIAPAFAGTTSITGGTAYLVDPVQPHSFPYLVDKFFYTGASNFYYPPTAIATDPSAGGVPVVGGPAADGWFKMFEFLEVPSQMIGAIGPVALGNNFDWLRQDIKPGLTNINLIIDEEVFFSVFGRQDGSFNQTLLNSVELPLLINPSTSLLPYSMPLSGYVDATTKNELPPIPTGGPPVPLVVSAVQANGAPNYAYPITNQFQFSEHGFLLPNDPIQTALNPAISAAGGTISPPVGNRIKAAFAQFLWLRHGGSGYLFGYGTGATGQNSSVATLALSSYGGALPAERYFHSLSYPDIDYTIMRPAALPPSTYSMPAIVPSTASTFSADVANAQSLLYSTETAPTSSNWYFGNNAMISATNAGYFYAPYCPGNTNFAAEVPIVYSGDPGVRNPLLSQGYSSTGATSPYTVQTSGFGTAASYSVPQGIPLPVNVAFPSGATTAPVPLLDAVVMPPPIPPRRLFQPVDGYGSAPTGSTGLPIIASGYTGTTTLALVASNASDFGDPWINNQIPSAVVQAPATALGYAAAPVYSLNNGFANLAWSGGAFYDPTAETPADAPLPPTGSLPLVSAAYAPYSQTSVLAGLSNLSFTSNSTTVDNAVKNIYLGTGTGGTSNTDDRQHPYWRSEQLQKVMNLTTTRTHQYAVWVTIGFFQVKRQGDLAMFSTDPQLAFDIMGPEIGAANGKNTRYRAFYLIDRLQLTGFNPATTSNFRSAVLYSNRIQ